MASQKTKVIADVVQALQAGLLVGLPTETVYGLAADATAEAAVLKVFAAKGRPADHPLIVHVGSVSMLQTVVAEIPPLAQCLIDHFWPGPLTLVLPKHPTLSPLITGHQAYVAVRMPRHPLFQAVLSQLGKPLVAPSANRFESISPTDSDAVLLELGDQLAWVLEGGRCEIGLESTIVQIDPVNSHQWRILRPGSITATQISNAVPPVYQQAVDTQDTRNLKNTVKVSGNKIKHYAPQTPAFYLTREALLGKTSGICLGLGSAPHPLNHLNNFNHVRWVAMPEDPVCYARDFYAALRAADQQHPETIWIESPPRTEPWEAIWDRLRRAAQAV